MTYQEKAYNLSYPPQQNYGYQSYNQYDGNATQRNYQSNSKPMARSPALPPPLQVVTSQPMEQSNNNVERQDPSKRSSSRILSLWPTQNYTINWFKVVYYHRLISHHYNHHTSDGIMRTSTTIIIRAIEDTLWRTAQRWNEGFRTSSKKRNWPSKMKISWM